MTPASRASVSADDTLAAGAALAGAVVLVWLATGPLRATQLYVPWQHFYIVTAVAALAFALSAVVAVATVQIGLYRVLFLALGFMAMGGLFAVHGLATPGILIPDYGAEYQGSVLGLSAFLSLFVPAGLFALSYLPATGRLERVLPFWPAGWLVAVTGVAIIVFGGLAIGSSEAVAELPLSRPPFSWGLAGASTLLLVYAAVRQAAQHRAARLRPATGLVVAYLLLAEAQVAMVVAPPWTAAWWGYHAAMLTAVALALRAIAIERIKGRSLRGVLESMLQLEVSVGVELDNVDTIAALASAVEMKDRETQGHNVRVAELAVAIGRELGLDTARLRVLARSGLLHDVGKLGIPDAILHKPGELDQAEWAVIKTHPLLGVQILSRVGRLKQESQAVLHHHERFDGTGYPAGLAGSEIPLEARVIAVADTFDVLVSDRPYRKARSVEQAQVVLSAERGAQLDPDVVEALLRTLGRAHTVNASTEPPVPNEVPVAT